jgi:hypothetical protein
MFVAMPEFTIFADNMAPVLTVRSLTRVGPVKYYDFCSVISKLKVDKSGNGFSCMDNSLKF